jgi:hypothetical protein
VYGAQSCCDSPRGHASDVWVAIPNGRSGSIMHPHPSNAHAVLIACSHHRWRYDSFVNWDFFPSEALPVCGLPSGWLRKLGMLSVWSLCTPVSQITVSYEWLCTMAPSSCFSLACPRSAWLFVQETYPSRSYDLPTPYFQVLVYFKETQTPADKWDVGPGGTMVVCYSCG